MLVLVRRQSKRFQDFQGYCTRSEAAIDFSQLQALLQDLDEQKPVLHGPAAWIRLLNSCSNLKALEQGKQLHAHLATIHLGADPAVGTALLSMYCKCGSIEDAKLVFDGLQEKSVFSWTMLIGAYAQKGHSTAALALLKKMQLEGVRPNDVTFISALAACTSPSQLSEGVLIHSCASQIDLRCKVAIGNTLVSMYGKCGSLEDARNVFYSMDLRDPVSWRVMISGCSRYENCEDQVLELFQKMQLEGFKPSHVTLGIVLQACARLQALEQACRMLWMHLNAWKCRLLCLGTR